LLTGKTRLTGFKDKWSVKSLKSVGQCIRGVSYQGDADLSSHDKSYTKRLLRSNNIQNGFVVTNDIQFVNAKRVSDAQLLKKNDILICMANGSKFLVGKSGLFNVVDGDDYTFGAFMGAFRVNQKLADPRFVFFLFQTSQYKNYINNLLVGSSINNLTSGIIDSLEFYFPSYTEQEAIANILSNMDEELLKLEERLNKIKQLKQAMMQELLTGKTRLINKEFSNA
jgi:type I restriction enzyme S subunit